MPVSVLLGSEGFPISTVLDEVTQPVFEEAKSVVLQATADCIQDNVMAFGPAGILFENQNPNSISVNLDGYDPYGLLAEATHGSMHDLIWMVSEEKRADIFDSFPDHLPQTVDEGITLAANTTASNVRAGMFIMARLLQVLPKVYEAQFPHLPLDPVQLAGIARNSISLVSTFAARDKVSGTHIVSLLLQDTSVEVDSPRARFDPSRFRITTMGANGHQILLTTLSKGVLKTRKPRSDGLTKREECPALHVKPSTTEDNLIKVVWQSMVAIAEGHHYQELRPTTDFPSFSLGRLSVLAARKLGPYSDLPRRTEA